MFMKINTPLNAMLIYMCAKFGGLSFKIATEKVNHRISARCVAMPFRPKKSIPHLPCGIEINPTRLLFPPEP